MNVLVPEGIFLFEGFRFDRRAGGLFRVDGNGAAITVPLGARALDVLGVLIARPGDIVSKDEITAAVWPGRIVEDSNLPTQISVLRRAIDAGRLHGSCIQTVSGRGYRFVRPVTLHAAGMDAGASLGLHDQRRTFSLDGVKPSVPVANTRSTEQQPSSVASAERRQLTVMICDLAGAATLASRLDPEELREIIAAYHRTVTEIVASFDGFVGRYVDDTVLVYFGYPRAHEDDAERAVRAGLGVIGAAGCLDLKSYNLQTRVGIATGLVVVSEGSAQGQSVIGATPYLAARLKVLAQPDTIVIAAGTHQLTGGLFEYRDLGTVQVEGIAAPVRAWEVLRPSGVASRFEALRGAALSPLIGRDEEVELLLRRWARAKAGDGQVVLLSGEPGIGKSRFVTALAERLQAEPHLRLRYFCSSYHQDSALFPFIDQLERAGGFARDDTATMKLDKLEALLGDGAEPGDISLITEMLSISGGERYPPLDLSPQRKKEKLLEALNHQLEGLARKQPVLMVFEDAHWADPTSREVLDLTVERVRSLPVLLLVTFRPEFQPVWAGQSQVTMLTLNRLDRRHRTTLVGQIVGGKALPDEVLNQIADRTDGVPLFIEELTKSVLESGHLREEKDRYVIDKALPPFVIPTSLHDSLMARLDRLGSVRLLAQIGAAIGGEFSYELVHAVSRLPEAELRTSLARLVASGLVFQRGTPPTAKYLFKHALVQDTAYSTLLRGPRQALHRRIAEALEQRFPDLVATRPEILAHHYGEAAMADKAIIYWHRAGKSSVAKSAVHEAIAQLRRGLGLLDALPETRERQQLESDIHVTLTAALMAAKGHADPEVVATLERANRLVTETAAVGSPTHFSVLYGLWVSTLGGGDIGAALEHAANLLSVAQSQPSSGPLLVAHRALGHSLLLRGDHRAALAHLETAASLHRPDEHRGSAFHYGQDIGVSAFVMLSWALWHRGYPDQSARAADRALAYSRELGHAHTLAYAFAMAGVAAILARDVATVHVRGNDCVAVANEHGFAQWAARGRILQGWAAAQKGEATTGIARIRDGLAANEATGARGTPQFLTLLADALALAGKIEEGLAALDDALAQAAVFGVKGYNTEIHRLRGVLTARLPHPDPAKAEESFRTALTIAREQGTRGYELRAATSLARLWGEQGRRGEALDLLAPVWGWFTEGFDTADLKEAKRLLDELA